MWVQRVVPPRYERWASVTRSPRSPQTASGFTSGARRATPPPGASRRAPSSPPGFGFPHPELPREFRDGSLRQGLVVPRQKGRAPFLVD